MSHISDLQHRDSNKARPINLPHHACPAKQKVYAPHGHFNGGRDEMIARHEPVAGVQSDLDGVGDDVKTGEEED